MHIHPFILGILVLQPLSPVAANDVAYKWVDKNGVTNFSDKPPATNGATHGDVESIDLPGDFTELTDPAGDYYSITNQWKRMNEERIERKKLALEQEWVRLERSRTALEDRAAPAYVETTPVVVYGGGIPRFVHPRPFFRGHPPFHGKLPGLSHKLPRKDFKPRKHNVFRKSSFGNHHGHGDLEHMPVRGLKSRCC